MDVEGAKPDRGAAAGCRLMATTASAMVGASGRSAVRSKARPSTTSPALPFRTRHSWTPWEQLGAQWTVRGPMIIAIDGPAGSGKSTIAREVAKRLGMRYVDTGAMYRAITLLALEAGLVPDRLAEAEAIAAANGAAFRAARRTTLTGSSLAAARSATRSAVRLSRRRVSPVSADPGVRRVLTARQRAEAAKGNVVARGPGHGHRGLPGCGSQDVSDCLDPRAGAPAPTANREKGIEQSVDELIADIAARDAYDSGREHAPLRKADDAVEIDTTGMTISEVIDSICDLAEERRPKPHGP